MRVSKQKKKDQEEEESNLLLMGCLPFLERVHSHSDGDVESCLTMILSAETSVFAAAAAVFLRQNNRHQWAAGRRRRYPLPHPEIEGTHSGCGTRLHLLCFSSELSWPSLRRHSSAPVHKKKK